MKYKNINYDDLLQSIYLDWCNEFLTVEGFAGYYGISEITAALVKLRRHY